MRYLDKTFSLPTSTNPQKISQTDWEIRVGLRNQDGSLRKPKKKNSRLNRMEPELSE